MNLLMATCHRLLAGSSSDDHVWSIAYIPNGASKHHHHSSWGVQGANAGENGFARGAQQQLSYRQQLLPRLVYYYINNQIYNPNLIRYRETDLSSFTLSG